MPKYKVLNLTPAGGITGTYESDNVDEGLHFFDANLYVVDASVDVTAKYVDRQALQLADIPECPYEQITIFDPWSLTWLPPPGLGDAKATRREYVNAERLKANQSSFAFGGKQISTDALARSDIDAVNGLVALTGAMPAGWIGAWKATDNSYVPVPDVATWNELYAAMVAQGLAYFAHAQALKAQIDAATTIEEVNAVVW